MREKLSPVRAGGARKAVASPKRLERSMLCRAYKDCSVLAAQADISVKLASAHLKEPRRRAPGRDAREGAYVPTAWPARASPTCGSTLRSAAEERLVEYHGGPGQPCCMATNSKAWTQVDPSRRQPPGGAGARRVRPRSSRRRTCHKRDAPSGRTEEAPGRAAQGRRRRVAYCPAHSAWMARTRIARLLQ